MNLERLADIREWHADALTVDPEQKGHETWMIGQLLEHIDKITPRAINTPEELLALPLGSAVLMHGGRPGMTVQGFTGRTLIDFAGQSGWTEADNLNYYPMVDVTGLTPKETK